MNTRSQKFPLIPGISLGALLGALALMLLVSLPDLFLRVVQGNLNGLTGILRSALYGAFTTPWGAIGALIGGTMAWKRLRAQRESAGIPADSWRIFHPGEAMVAWGFVCLLASFGVYPSVMTWFLALWTLPLASVLLLMGVLRARDSAASAAEQFAGFGLLLLGVVALGAAALAGTNLSYKLAFHVQRPTSQVPNLWEWARFAGSCPIPVLLICPGLRLWTDWSRSRRIGWCAVMLLFPVIAMLLHRTLAAIGFLGLSA